MKKILNLSVLCLLLAFASCKKNEMKSDATPQLANNKTNSTVNNYYGNIGYGYDATGEYASINSAKLKIIEIEKLEKDYPNRVNVAPGVEQYTIISAGANSRDYTTDLTTKFTGALDFKLFGGSVKSSFKDSSKTSNKYSYANVSSIIKQRIVTLNAPEDLIISNYLTEEFKVDINTMTPQQIVAAYGTHILTNIVLGAKLELSYRSITNNSDKKTAVTAGAVANGLVKFFSLTTDISYNESLVKTNTEQTLSYHTVGGDANKGLIGEVLLDKPIEKVNIGEWQNTLRPDNALLIDILKNGAIPIYNLISDPAKKEAVRIYVNQYLKNNEVRDLGDVPIYSYYNASATDHYLTTVNQPFVGGGFKNEGPQFYAFPEQKPGTVPVYSYYNAGATDHYFSTLNQPSVGGGFLREGIMFYVYPNNPKGTVAVYSYYNAGATDHYFTTLNQPTVGGGFLNEGSQFYVPN